MVGSSDTYKSSLFDLLLDKKDDVELCFCEAEHSEIIKCFVLSVIVAEKSTLKELKVGILWSSGDTVDQNMLNNLRVM